MEQKYSGLDNIATCAASMFWWRTIPLSRGLHVNRWLKETLKSVKEQIVKYWCIDCKIISTISGRYPEAPDYVGESAGADLPRYWWLNLDKHLHIPEVCWHHRRVQSRGKISEQTGVFRRVRSTVQINSHPWLGLTWRPGTRARGM